MEIENGRITMLLNDDGLSIELIDDNASITFARVKLNRGQTCQALSRLAYTHCTKMEVRGLDRVGKKMEHKTLEFVMPDCSWADKRQIAELEAKKQCPKGWVCSDYFGSQNSFFRKDSVEYARTTIRRWV